MKLRDKLELESSETRAQLNRLAATDELTDDQRTEMRTLSAKLDDLECRRQAAIRADPLPQWQATEQPAQQDTKLDELRSKARIGNYLSAALSGRALTGPEAELQSETGATGIPLSLTEPERRGATEHRVDAVTPTPGTTGTNIDGIVPYVFSRSIAPRIGVMMPRVMSGTYSVPRLTTALTSGPVAKGAKRESSAGAFTSVTSTPKRVSARLSVAAEDIAGFGRPDFEASLRSNLMMALSDELDEQLLRGSGTAPNLQGLIGRFTAPTAATTTITFATYAAMIGGLVDGVWADSTRDVTLVTNPATYAKLVSTFASSDDSVSAANWAMNSQRALITHARMPASASGVATALAVKLAMPTGDDGRRAVLPVWSDIAITDVYSDSGAAVSHFSVHCICGDAMLLQPGAYALTSIKHA